MEKSNSLNPWIHIWTQPRAVMREVFVEKHPPYIWLLFLLGSFVWALDTAATEYYWDTMGNNYLLFIFILLLGVGLSTVINFYFMSWLIKWTGNLIGGEGTMDRVRTAYAYSFIPSIYSLVVIWFPLLLLFGMENFSKHSPTIDAQSNLFFLISAVEFIIAIWGIVITLKVIGEAHNFSAWKALLAGIIAFFVIFIPLLLIVLIFII